MRAEGDWPSDAQDRVFILRAIQVLSANGLSTAEARDKIISWLNAKPNNIAYALAPNGEWFGLKSSIFLMPENAGGIFSSGQWRNRKFRGGPRSYDSLARGAAADVYLPANCLTAIASPPKDKGGRTAVHDWSNIKEQAFALLDQNGDFSLDDPEWCRASQLEKGLADYCQQKWDRVPSSSTLRERIGPWRLEWLKAKGSPK